LLHEEIGTLSWTVLENTAKNQYVAVAGYDNAGNEGNRVTLKIGSSYKTGDADGNGIVNINDALLVAQYDVRMLTKDELPGFAFADADCNGKVDIFDALRIAEYDAELKPAPECK